MNIIAIGIDDNRQNTAIVWLSNFFVAGSITMLLPFLSLYIENMDNLSEADVQKWSGVVFGITFVTAVIFSPLWGRFGDKYGRKPTLIISALGMGTALFLMGISSTVWQLFILRLLMGIFVGFIPISQALISTQSSKKDVGKALGTLQTGNVTGMLVGPLLGGMLADLIGYGKTFQLVSLTIFLSALLILLGIKEKRIVEDEEKDKKIYSSKEIINYILKRPILLVTILLSALIQIAHFSIQPILSLYVEVINGPNNIAFYSGLAFSIAGIGNLLMARKWGRIGKKIGYIKLIIILICIAGFIYIPTAHVSNIWQLILLRLVLGTAMGGIIPVRVAYIRFQAPITMQGEILGYNSSLRFLGNIVGPVLGGTLSATFGFVSVFYVTSALLFISGWIMFIIWRKNN